MGHDERDERGGLLESLLQDADKTLRSRPIADAQQAVEGLVRAARQAAKLETEQRVRAGTPAQAQAEAEAEVEVESPAARAQAAEEEASAATRSLIGAVARSARPATEPTSASEARLPSATLVGKGRVRRPAARFGPEDLLALDQRSLLTVVAQVEPLDLVLACASRGAGGLCDRLLALLPAGTREALFEAIKAAGITPDEEATAAWARVAEIVSNLDHER